MHNEFLAFIHDNLMSPEQLFENLQAFPGVHDKLVDFVWEQVFFQYAKLCMTAPPYSGVDQNFQRIKNSLVDNNRRADVDAMIDHVQNTFQRKRDQDGRGR